MKVFDVVIATYNRHEKVVFLINQLLPISSAGKLGRIIVVDSTDIPLNGDRYNDHPHLVILPSSHKNQPYQRLLGLEASRAEFVLFLDDDMEVSDMDFCGELSQFVSSHPEVVGVNLKFENVNHFLHNLDGSMLSTGSSIVRWIRLLSGYPEMQENTFWLAGIRGKRVDDKTIQYVSGGAFLAKRESVFKGISCTLFDIFEKKMGMGEDSLIGYSLSKSGKVIAWPKTYFLHNDQQDSTYTSGGHRRFYKKVSYSRLFLSMEYTHLNNTSRIFAIVHYAWYATWRIAGLLFNLCLRPSKRQWNMCLGYLEGSMQAIFGLAPIYLAKRQNNNCSSWKESLEMDTGNLLQ